jgi:ETC complex I subunit conserved region
MKARIYKPARNAMQSGTAKMKMWLLEYEPENARQIEPLMGWTSSSDTKQQVQLRFDTKEEAVAYAERHGIAFEASEPKPQARRTMAYADNFAFSRRTPWTH